VPGVSTRGTGHGTDRLYERGSAEPRGDGRVPAPRRMPVVAHKRHRVIPHGAMPAELTGRNGGKRDDDES
jgi:hypothetical protein